MYKVKTINVQTVFYYLQYLVALVIIFLRAGGTRRRRLKKHQTVTL